MKTYCWRWTADPTGDVRRGYSWAGEPGSDDGQPLAGLSGYQDARQAREYGERWGRPAKGQRLVCFRVARYAGRGEDGEDLFVPAGAWR